MKKRKTIMSLIALCTALMLLATGCTGAATAPQSTDAPAAEPTATAEPTADPMAEYSVIGPWGLSTAKNDMAALYTVFGTSLRDYGASMEIKSSGEMQYAVGATGGVGTYTRQGGVISAQVKDFNEGNESTLELQLAEEGGKMYLTCQIYDAVLWWTQSEDELAAAAGAGEMDTSAYDALLEVYRTALRDKYDDTQLAEAGLNYMFNFYREKDGLAEIGYCFKDFDGDGSPELLIAPVGGDDFYSDIVFDMYTLTDGQPTQLFSAGERYRYYLLSDNTIYFEGANSADESIFEQFTIANGSLSEMMCLRLNGSADSASQWSVSYSGSEFQPISDADADAMISNWQNQITKPEYTPFGA